MRTRGRRDGPARTGRPLGVWLYIVGAVVLGLSALLGGFMLVMDPSGAALSIPLDYLEGSPFTDYLIPGIILFVAFGIGSFVVLYAIYRRLVWAWYGAVSLGLGQVIWIAVEMLIMGELQLLHVVYGLLGLVLVGLALLPSVRTELR